MKRKVTTGWSMLALAALLSPTWGCVVFVSAGCDWERSPAVWIEESSQISIDPTGLAALEVRTHNGEIAFTGGPPGNPGSATVRKKVGGSSDEDAREAMAAIEIISERSSGGEHKLAWRWKAEKRSRWAAEVAFTIQAPGNIRLDAETHNGAVTATGVAGDLKLVTHNGAVTAASRDGKLCAQTHNGAIKATYSGPDVSLISHNGEIKVDLKEAGRVKGEIETHNGAIELAVGAATAAELVAETDNGRVRVEGLKTDEKEQRSPQKQLLVSKLELTFGAGGDRLNLSTHNGSVSIKSAG